MSNIKIFSVTIDHFRGFRDPQTFTLDSGSDFVLLSGFNGFGKTSFYDAIEWGFTGELFRYKDPNEDKKRPFITYQPFEQPAKVTIEFGDEKAKYTLFREIKKYDGNSDYGANKTTLTISGPGIKDLKNKKAIDFLNDIMIKDEWKGRVDFQKNFSLFHLLTQDKLKHFVQGLKSPERYKELSTLIGTDDFSKYKDKIKKVRDHADGKKANLVTKIEGSNNEINILNNLIEVKKDFNIGKEDRLDEFISKLLSEFNSICLKYDIDPIIFDYDDLLDSINKFKEDILMVKANINSKIKNNNKKEENFEALKVEEKNYYSNLQKVKKLVV
ncbi:MAG: AAA family ATPase [Halanaerobiales bacterium]|nr:AAA family ATPase [Halanaerobiales bacterium]